MAADAKSGRTAPWILGLGWLAFLVVGYPGQVTADSIDQLTEARAGFFTDAHPPLMSFLWRYIDKIVPGTFGMLVLQTGLLLAGLYLVFRRVASERVAAACAVGLMWFPPVSAPMMVIWKDSLMAGACMLGFALLLDARLRRRIIGLALIAFGVVLRYNGLALALPLVILLFELRPGERARTRYAIGVAAWFAVAVINVGVNDVLADRKMHFWSSTLAVMDVAGTLCYDTQRHYSDAELEQMFAGTDLRVHENIEARMCQLFALTTQAHLIDPYIGMWSMAAAGTTPTPEPRRDAITRVWKSVVPSRPIPYLKYRLSVFNRVLALRTRPWGMVTPSVPQIEVNHPDRVAALGLPPRSSALQSGWIAVSTWLAESTPLFRPWLYVSLALVLLAFVRRRDMIALLLGGIAMEGSLVFLAMSPDYRYSHWLVLSVCVAGMSHALKVRWSGRTCRRPSTQSRHSS